ncbi:unnamed protein product [Nesidiocoris tenuis]|uniref:Uncharacterized protein n=1 Tax=Nesidiocoris tenuis TaxID=355587 RepID=A0A6H5FTX6_9HEMI|nr:unnamed protein product [Nesidiocoris tenuis]
MLKALKPKRKMTLTTPKTRGTNVWLISTPRVALAPTEVAALAAVRAISSSTSFGSADRAARMAGTVYRVLAGTDDAGLPTYDAARSVDPVRQT